MHRYKTLSVNIGCAMLTCLFVAGCSEVPPSSNAATAPGSDVNSSPGAAQQYAAAPTTGWHVLPPARDVLNGRVTLAVTNEPVTSSVPYDFDHGNIATDVIIPSAVPVILSSLGHGDATLILRITALSTNAWFDAIAPYHPTAVGIYSHIRRRPRAEHATNRQRNIAIIYATYRVVLSLMPQFTTQWQNMLTSVGLDANDNSTDLTTPVGIGNAAGAAVVAARKNDGMNQLGDEGGRQFNRHPYQDYTGYAPRNTAYELRSPGHWQPNFVTADNGIFRIQQFVTPQLGETVAYSFDSVRDFVAPVPVNSNPANWAAYKRQADEVLAASAALTDETKMLAELFDHKFRSLAASSVFAAEQANLSLDDFVAYDFIVNGAAFDGGIAAWKNKAMYDTVRPFSAIHHIYGDSPVTAWGGPGKGRVTNLPGNEWRSYLNVADHPEYPSGSACFCAAHAEASRRFLHTDKLGFDTLFPKGSSEIEPGISPSKDVTVSIATWSDFETQCQNARVVGGVHFKSAVKAGADLCRSIGDSMYEMVVAHVAGDEKNATLQASLRRAAALEEAPASPAE